MPHPAPRRWHPWRLAACRPRFTLAESEHRLPMIPTELRAEAPGPDGVRHNLVAHVRTLIAAGEYDAPGCLAAAEEALFRRVEAGR